MRIRSLVGALALSAALPLALPTEAQAAHRHSRSCGHRYYDSYSYSPYRSYGYYDGYRGSRGYRGYDYGYRTYGYRPYYRTRYYAPPPGYYYYRAPRYYRRPHFSIHLDF